MTVKITRPDGGTSVEVLGGALVPFVRNVARVTGYVSQLRPSVAAALRRRGYEVENERKPRPAPPADRSPVNAPPAPPAPVVVEDQADELATVQTADGVEHVGTLPASAAAGSDADVDGVGAGE